MLDTDEIDLTIPANFEMNVDTKSRFCKFSFSHGFFLCPHPLITSILVDTPSPNPQTAEFCKLLGIDDVIGNACPPPPPPAKSNAATPDKSERVSSSTTSQTVLEEEPSEHKDEANRAPATNEKQPGDEQVLPPKQTATAAGDVDKDQAETNMASATTETQSHDEQALPTQEGNQSPKRQKLN